MNRLTLASRTATLTNLNTTTEKRGHDDVPMVDLSFRTAIEAADLQQLTGISGKTWAGMLMEQKKDLAGETFRLAENGLASIVFDNEFKHHNLQLNPPSMKAMKFDDARVRKFWLELDRESHSLMLHFQARMEPSNLLDELAACIKQTFTIAIDPPTDKQLKIILKEAEKIAKKAKATAGPDAEDDGEGEED